MLLLHHQGQIIVRTWQSIAGGIDPGGYQVTRVVDSREGEIAVHWPPTAKTKQPERLQEAVPVGNTDDIGLDEGDNDEFLQTFDKIESKAAEKEATAQAAQAAHAAKEKEAALQREAAAVQKKAADTAELKLLSRD
ncbi:MAG: hypothetical protein Q9172_000672 [Xanthocarpia lactea]